MLSSVLRTVWRHALFAAGDGVLVAVSGGPDSMALLAALWELAPRLGLRLEVATIDHGLRPAAADERRLVAARAAALGLPFHEIAVDVAGARTAGRRPRGGIQETARRLRLAALADLARARGLPRIALGHQADDQAETILFRIVRGTGIEGLRGIPYRRGPFVRPLLDVTRARIAAYLRRRAIPHVSDPSNLDRRFARARLRHEILPILRRENPRVDEALRALAAAATALASPSDPDARALGEVRAVTAAAGQHLPAHLAREIAWAAREGRGTRRFDIGGARALTVSYGRVRVEPSRPRSTRAPVAPPPIRREPIWIDGPGVYPMPPTSTVVVREAAGSSAPSEIPGDPIRWAWFDGDRLSWPLAARVRRPGDRMHPRGGTGRRKLSDLLIDAKVPRDARASLPVVTAADGELLLFVPGLRPSREAAPSATTRRWIGLGVAALGSDAPGEPAGPDGVLRNPLVDPSIFGGNTGGDGLLKRHSRRADDVPMPPGLNDLNERIARAPGT